MSEPQYLLPDELVQSLLNAIQDAGRASATASAELADLRQRLKTTEAVLMGFAESEGIRSHAKQTQYARSHPTYLELSGRVFGSVEKAALRELDLKNAEREYEAWRTISANERHAR